MNLSKRILISDRISKLCKVISIALNVWPWVWWHSKRKWRENSRDMPSFNYTCLSFLKRRLGCLQHCLKKKKLGANLHINIVWTFLIWGIQGQNFFWFFFSKTYWCPAHSLYCKPTNIISDGFVLEKKYKYFCQTIVQLKDKKNKLSPW